MMRLYTWPGPNPAVVHAMLLERQARVEMVVVDLLTKANREPEFLRLNPAGKLPLLVVDDAAIAESLAICEYLDEVLPGPSLIGDTAAARAVTRMWLRRIDLGVVQPAANGWRFADGLPFCREIMHVIPAAADDLKAIAAETLTWIDGEMADNAYVCGDRLTLADILLFIFVDFADRNGQPIDPALKWIAGWRKRLDSHRLATALDFDAARSAISQAGEVQ